MSAFLARLAAEPAVLVTVDAAQGSVPREAGAWMAVFADAIVGTVGGGRLEYEAIDEARAVLAGGPVPPPRRYPLGPSLGQCCGGVVHLAYEPVHASQAAALRERLGDGATPVALFGGGHVGHALIGVLANLPFAVRWIDSRDEVFPAAPPLNVVCEHSDPVQAAVRDLAPGSRVIIMSFSHAEDLDIVAACLQRARQTDDLPFIGLIGSRTKWATFRRRLEARGFGEAELERVTCPIGIPGIRGKQPEIIAVAVAAQLLLLV
ncbi:MAG: xanthine dehydrogenase accessory protein XdhC [Comamonadaceae bacterium]|nr:MAG: xanthine dehydrogenase accessory protein XdhC [Comamonadaceae bacterium]